MNSRTISRKDTKELSKNRKNTEMALIGQLTAGDGVTTKFTVENLPQILFIANSGQLQDIESIVVTVDGTTIWNCELGDENLLDILAQLGHNIIDGANNLNSSFFLLSNGYLEGVPCVISITNADATATPNVYGFSLAQVGIGDFDPTNLDTQIVLQSQNKEFAGLLFDYIVFDDANYSKADIVFSSGRAESDLTETELKTLLSLTGNVPAGIEADNQIVIDNTQGNIESLKLYASSGGNLNVLTFKL